MGQKSQRKVMPGRETALGRLPAYDVSQFPVGEKDHDDELKELKDEAEY